MDIKISGWKCDICGEEFFEDSCGVNAGYDLKISTPIEMSKFREESFQGICVDCVEAIITL